jgi:hypothetical protein
LFLLTFSINISYRVISQLLFSTKEGANCKKKKVEEKLFAYFFQKHATFSAYLKCIDDLPEM